MWFPKHTCVTGFPISASSKSVYIVSCSVLVCGLIQCVSTGMCCLKRNLGLGRPDCQQAVINAKMSFCAWWLAVHRKQIYFIGC